MNFTAFCWNVGGILTSTRIPGMSIRSGVEACGAELVCLQEATEPEALAHLSGPGGEYTVLRASEGRRDNAILTTLPILEHGALDGDVFRPASRQAQYQQTVWATVVAGGTAVRVYNCHLPIVGVGIAERTHVFGHVLEHAVQFPGPAVICGDMNTTIPRAGIGRRVVQWIHKEPTSSLTVDGAPWQYDERYAFARVAEVAGFSDAMPITSATWAIPHTSWEILGLKLDWFLLRGMRASHASLGPFVTDHRAVTVRCEV